MLSDRKLVDMGYDKESIDILRNFDGSEDQIVTLSASLSLSCSISQYFYREGKTYAVISYNWSWSSMPFWTMTDIIGIAWDPSFYQTPNNVNDKQTISKYNGNTYVGTYVTALSCKSPGNAAGCEFPVLINERKNHWAKSATGKVYIAASGYVSEMGVRVAYGHSTGVGSPGVSFPGGVSISFTGNCSEAAADYDYASL